MKYKCECGDYEKEINKISIVYRQGNWVTKGSECPCGKYMDSEPEEGMPTIKRTEPSLRKKGDYLWDSAKEKLVGERGVNEDFA
tara:strand:- start:99 stop:350 length:252 start_codon:yes stop_codon:yes gene_type:complete